MISIENTIGAIVAKHLHTAAVFGKFGLDFCCNGNRTIVAACGEAGIDPDTLMAALREAMHTGMPGMDFDAWPLDLLADYIEKRHHRYVTSQVPVLLGYLDKLRMVHGRAHPELFEIMDVFTECAGELAAHMKKEELMLFPFIRKMVQAKQSGATSLTAPFGTVQNPVKMMMHEHDMEGERFRKIAALCDRYTAPADACNTYRVALASLKAFEDDLHLHIHLENNILFPKAIALEAELRGGAASV